MVTDAPVMIAPAGMVTGIVREVPARLASGITWEIAPDGKLVVVGGAVFVIEIGSISPAHIAMLVGVTVPTRGPTVNVAAALASGAVHAPVNITLYWYPLSVDGASVIVSVALFTPE
jgi:hypothetical protein